LLPALRAGYGGLLPALRAGYGVASRAAQRAGYGTVSGFVSAGAAAAPAGSRRNRAFSFEIR
jgi:hypothetical protein